MYRFAPSLTKDMDISNLRIALFNYICAKQSSEQFVVRIEDTQKKKNIEEKDKEILDILAIFGLSYDGLYYQSENFKYHLQFASYLMDKGKAFACFCSEKELKKSKSYSGKCINISQDELLYNNLPFVIRIKKPIKAAKFKDIIKKELNFAPDEIDSFVIMQKDKYPTRNFACATDDMIQGITTIIETDERLIDAPKQEYIRHSLGFHEDIKYAHVPTLLYDKNESSSNVKSLLDLGFMPEAILNYLILLGSNTPTEIFTLEEAIHWFELDKISTSPARFELEKLKFINREHIKLIEDIELSKRIGYSCTKIGQLAKLYTQEVSTTLEIKQKVDILFSRKEDDELKYSLENLKKVAKNAPFFEEFNDFRAYMEEKSKLQGEDFSKSLYFLLTGSHSGPSFSELYPLIKNYLQEIIK